MATTIQRTCILIKPDGVQRGLVGETIGRFESKGYKLVAMKLMRPSRPQVEEHYRDMQQYNFFPRLCTYMVSGNICVMVWEGRDVIRQGRRIIGPPMPRNAKLGSIRGAHTLDIGRNVCHGSDSVQSAASEIELWFPEGVVEWTSCKEPWVAEKG